MSVSVRRENLLGVITLKLNTASFSVHNLLETEQPAINGHWLAKNYVDNFLTSVHGVFAVIKTFGDGILKPAGFKAWLQGWEASALSDPAKLALWKRMRLERTLDEHGEGAELIPFDIEVTQGAQLQTQSIVTLKPGEPAPRIQTFKTTVRFAAYPNRAASDVCEQHRQMCERFAVDFVRDHGHLLPAAT